jgi:uncharacterized protein YbjQ (UPF0145 family)
MPLPPQNIDFKQSLDRVRQGGIPIRAELRLREEAGPHPHLFTSDLSVNEFVLAKQAGAHPISQVMGSSIFHVGRIADYKGATGEVQVLSDAHREARRLALSRLWQEARAVGADAVVGVRLSERLVTKGAHGKGGDDGDEILEFTVVGTAVRAPFMHAQQGNPIISDLSGQDLWALASAGYQPVGLVYDYCHYHVWHVLGDQSTWAAAGEVQQASQAIDVARGLVEQRVTKQAHAFGAEFVVGQDIRVRVKEVPCGYGGCRLNDLDVDVFWIGTAVRPIRGYQPPSKLDAPPLILGMMPLGQSRRREVVEGEESESAELEKQAKEEEEKALEADEGGEE